MPMITPPAQFGRYRVVGYIAEGLSGEVYRAVDGQNQQLALKLFKERNDPTVWSYFINEELLLRKITEHRKHPHIVRYVTSNLTQKPPYLVTQFIAGSSLDKIVGNTPQSAAFVVHIIEQIAGALDYLHHGHPELSPIVHRDVKPENILVDRYNNAFLIDFSIASYPGYAVANEKNMGTPAYMAPEQYQLGKEVPASDQFALALVTFYMLTGKSLLPPKAKATTVQKMIWELHEQNYQKMRGLLGKHREQTANVLARALNPQPEARYEDCTTFANRLRNALQADGEVVYAQLQPIVARRISTEWIIMSALVVLALIILVSWFVIFGTPYVSSGL
ncbi:serine/threonine protein kinase [Chloroflexus sp.]|uniref:serine/threonine protein kinase n=1 Tax=Chloroflexus sp. TaxID=1904827 RepID=UPI00404AB179